MTSATTIGKKRSHNEVNPTEHKDMENTANIPFQQEFSPEMLKIYYKKLFPIEELFSWLSYFNDPESKSKDQIKIQNRKIFRNREFSFTLMNDVYVRYKSYANLQSFKKDLIKLCPIKIDIGAIYNFEPCRKSSISWTKFMPEEKELVFDIDISDYDDIRNCCSEAQICNKCWPLMACAIKVLDVCMREDFGFKHVLWVYSGRRGIHCWISDEKARKFNDRARMSIVNYLKLYSGEKGNNRIIVDMNVSNVGYIHDFLYRSYDICKQYFMRCTLEQQHFLDNEQGIEYLCGMIRDPDLQESVKQGLLDLLNCSSEHLCEKQWNCISYAFDAILVQNKKMSAKQKLMFSANRMEIVFSFTYPRLDVEVSKHMNHLLKSPFVIHPKTGKVCTIIDAEECDGFDPCNQPTLRMLIEEYNNVLMNAGGMVDEVGWQDTSLRSVVQTFRESFLNELREQFELQ